MIDIPMSMDLYYNTQIYFANHILPYLQNNEREWADGYRNWLKEQGCEITPHPRDLIKNTLGVSPGYDRFKFHDDQAAVAFLLRWS